MNLNEIYEQAEREANSTVCCTAEERRCEEKEMTEKAAAEWQPRGDKVTYSKIVQGYRQEDV